MASRIMHLVIAKLITKKIIIQDEQSFYLGSLAPDLSKYGSDNYNESHFGIQLSDIKGIDYSKFARKYYDKIISDEFIKGYLVHLVTDAIWLKDIQQVYIRNNHEEKESLYKLGYQDMKIYNSLLIEKYNINNLENSFINSTVDEINYVHLNDLIKDLESDFVANPYNLQLLQVYPYDSVIKFIMASVNQCVKIIRIINNGGNIDTPTSYFVPIGKNA